MGSAVAQIQSDPGDATEFIPSSARTMTPSVHLGSSLQKVAVVGCQPQIKGTLAASITD